MTTDVIEDELAQTRARAHGGCVVCGPANARGLGLAFASLPDGGVEARFACDHVFQGYAGVLHGGVIASLLDGAMTSCLFARGRAAVTAELNVQFRHPVVAGRTAKVRAWITRATPPLHVLAAQVVQDGQTKATATGKFMDQPRPAARKWPPP